MSHTPKNITDPDSHVDEWFKHDASEPHHQESHGDFNSPGIFITLGATIVGTFGVAIVVIIWAVGMSNDIKVEKQEASAYVTQQKVMAFSKWEGELHGEPEWIDQEAGAIRLPIEEAMRRVIERDAENR